MKRESTVNIKKHLEYWVNNNDGSGDEYRRKHDLDCILTQGNLNSDTIISLWLPLRYTLDLSDSTEWQEWRNRVLKGEIDPRLKINQEFIDALKNELDIFIPDHDLRFKLDRLFEIGRTRANVMILPYRSWNTRRGGPPYWDYLPHFLYDRLNESDEASLQYLQDWIKKEDLTVFFNGAIDKEYLKDLAGTGDVRKHNPQEINTELLIENYIEILNKRQELMKNKL